MMEFDDLPTSSRDQLAKLTELLDRKEDLHPDLVPHLIENRSIPALHHPLVINLFHSPMENARINAYYLQKKAHRDALIAARDWEGFVFVHERPYRIDALLEAIDMGLEDDPKLYWTLVGRAWIDSENIHQVLDIWIDLWSATIGEMSNVMDEDERKAFDALPDSVTVYRGYGHEDAVHGLSWTTDEEKARWFAKRFAGMDGRVPHVATGTVAKEDVLAYFTGRNESEIVVLPENVMDISVNQI